MGFRRLFFIFFLFAFFFFLFGKDIRVKIFSPMKLKEMKVTFGSCGSILTADGRRIFIKLRGSVSFKLKGELVLLEKGKEKFFSRRFLLNSPGGFHISNYLIKNRFYRGKLIILNKKGEIIPLIEKDVEDFIPSVIYSEAGKNLPGEFLKAFSIVIRTYIFSNLKRHLREGYNFCSSTHCFFYKCDFNVSTGDRINLNVVKGLLIKRDGKLISPFYSTCCGGVKFIQLNGKIFFKGIRKNPFCENSEHFFYKKKVERDFFCKSISKLFGINLYKIEYVIQRGIPFVFLHFPGGVKKIRVDKFRKESFKIFRGKLFLSNFFKINEDGKFLSVRGRGWGSNCGFCIEGAKNMALKGYDYKSILKYYFPGCDITPTK